MRAKPTCKRCGVAHFNFVKCEHADVENAADEQRRREREGTQVQVPISRVHTKTPLLVSRNFIMQAPGVYRRRRDRPA